MLISNALSNVDISGEIVDVNHNVCATWAKCNSCVPPLPCWLAVHREIRGNPAVRRVFDFLAEALPPMLG